MCTDYYLKRKSNLDHEWLIDTCSLLNVNNLNQLVNKKDVLTSNGIKLLVIKPVYEELNRHQYSKDEFFSKDAQYVLSVLYNNTDLFIIEGKNESMRIDEAFADPEIIRRVMKRCTKKSQLVITEDKKLATDILNIKNLNSFNSRKIYVCCLDEYGELNRNKGMVQKEVTNDTVIDVKENIIEDKEDELVNKFAHPLLYTVAGFTIGAFGTYAYQNKSTIYKNISNFTTSIRRCFSC